MQTVTFVDVLHAQQRLRPHLARTQLHSYPALNAFIGTSVFVKGYTYIHSANEPLLIARVGTETLEMLEDEPDLEVIIVPIGGGSGGARACIAAHAVNPVGSSQRNPVGNGPSKAIFSTDPAQSAEEIIKD